MQAGVHGNAIQPRKERAFAAELGQLHKGLEKRHLHHVFGLFARTDNPQDDIVKLVAALLDKLPERGAVSALGRSDQFASFVVCHEHGSIL
jgi:hypothetical protein